MSKAKENFQKEIIKNLQGKLNLKNKLAVPRASKVVINIGIGKIRENPNLKKMVEENLAIISGQKPKVTRARKAISGFKVRQGEEVGFTVTLRASRMYDFLYKLANIVLPRVRDFRGISEKGFDKNGNFTLALTEQVVFPEISHERTENPHGMSITIVTTAQNTKEGRMLLEALGFPFKKA